MARLASAAGTAAAGGLIGALIGLGIPEEEAEYYESEFNSAVDESLNAADTEFASFMARTNKYGHHVDGRSPAQRAEAAGYEYCVVRKNIAYRTNTGQVTAKSLIRERRGFAANNEVGLRHATS